MGELPNRIGVRIGRHQCLCWLICSLDRDVGRATQVTVLLIQMSICFSVRDGLNQVTITKGLVGIAPAVIAENLLNQGKCGEGFGETKGLSQVLQGSFGGI